MSKISKTLARIKFPNLERPDFGAGIAEQFNNIDLNFQKLVNMGLQKGESGADCMHVPINFNAVLFHHFKTTEDFMKGIVERGEHWNGAPVSPELRDKVIRLQKEVDDDIATFNHITNLSSDDYIRLVSYILWGYAEGMNTALKDNNNDEILPTQYSLTGCIYHHYRELGQLRVLHELMGYEAVWMYVLFANRGIEDNGSLCDFILKYIYSFDYGRLLVTISKTGDENSIKIGGWDMVGAMPYSFVDPRFRHENVYEDIKSASIQNDEHDISCILSWQPTSANDVGGQFVVLNLFPQLYYDKEAGKWYWMQNGVNTGIEAQGPSGKNGRNGQLTVVTRIENERGATPADPKGKQPDKPSNNPWSTIFDGVNTGLRHTYNSLKSTSEIVEGYRDNGYSTRPLYVKADDDVAKIETDLGHIKGDDGTTDGWLVDETGVEQNIDNIFRVHDIVNGHRYWYFAPQKGADGEYIQSVKAAEAVEQRLIALYSRCHDELDVINQSFGFISFPEFRNYYYNLFFGTSNPNTDDGLIANPTYVKLNDLAAAGEAGGVAVVTGEDVQWFKSIWRQFYSDPDYSPAVPRDKALERSLENIAGVSCIVLPGIGYQRDHTNTTFWISTIQVIGKEYGADDTRLVPVVYCSEENMIDYKFDEHTMMGAMQALDVYTYNPSSVGRNYPRGYMLPIGSKTETNNGSRQYANHIIYADVPGALGATDEPLPDESNLGAVITKGRPAIWTLPDGSPLKERSANSMFALNGSQTQNLPVYNKRTLHIASVMDYRALNQTRADFPAIPGRRKLFDLGDDQIELATDSLRSSNHYGYTRHDCFVGAELFVDEPLTITRYGGTEPSAGQLLRVEGDTIIGPHVTSRGVDAERMHLGGLAVLSTLSEQWSLDAFKYPSIWSHIPSYSCAMPGGDGYSFRWVGMRPKETKRTSFNEYKNANDVAIDIPYDYHRYSAIFDEMIGARFIQSIDGFIVRAENDSQGDDRNRFVVTANGDVSFSGDEIRSNNENVYWNFANRWSNNRWEKIEGHAPTDNPDHTEFIEFARTNRFFSLHPETFGVKVSAFTTSARRYASYELSGDVAPDHPMLAADLEVGEPDTPVDVVLMACENLVHLGYHNYGHEWMDAEDTAEGELADTYIPRSIAIHANNLVSLAGTSIFGRTTHAMRVPNPDSTTTKAHYYGLGVLRGTILAGGINQVCPDKSKLYGEEVHLNMESTATESKAPSTSGDSRTFLTSPWYSQWNLRPVSLRVVNNAQFDSAVQFFGHLRAEKDMSVGGMVLGKSFARYGTSRLNTREDKQLAIMFDNGMSSFSAPRHTVDNKKICTTTSATAGFTGVDDSPVVLDLGKPYGKDRLVRFGYAGDVKLDENDDLIISTDPSDRKATLLGVMPSGGVKQARRLTAEFWPFTRIAENEDTHKGFSYKPVDKKHADRAGMFYKLFEQAKLKPKCNPTITVAEWNDEWVVVRLYVLCNAFKDWDGGMHMFGIDTRGNSDHNSSWVAQRTVARLPKGCPVPKYNIDKYWGAMITDCKYSWDNGKGHGNKDKQREQRGKGYQEKGAGIKGADRAHPGIVVRLQGTEDITQPEWTNFKKDRGTKAEGSPCGKEGDYVAGDFIIQQAALSLMLFPPNKEHRYGKNCMPVVCFEYQYANPASVVDVTDVNDYDDGTDRPGGTPGTGGDTPGDDTDDTDDVVQTLLYDRTGESRDDIVSWLNEPARRSLVESIFDELTTEYDAGDEFNDPNVGSDSYGSYTIERIAGLTMNDAEVRVSLIVTAYKTGTTDLSHRSINFTIKLNDLNVKLSTDSDDDPELSTTLPPIKSSNSINIIGTYIIGNEAAPANTGAGVTVQVFGGTYKIDNSKTDPISTDVPDKSKWNTDENRPKVHMGYNVFCNGTLSHKAHSASDKSDGDVETLNEVLNLIKKHNLYLSDIGSYDAPRWINFHFANAELRMGLCSGSNVYGFGTFTYWGGGTKFSQEHGQWQIEWDKATNKIKSYKFTPETVQGNSAGSPGENGKDGVDGINGLDANIFRIIPSANTIIRSSIVQNGDEITGQLSTPTLSFEVVNAHEEVLKNVTDNLAKYNIDVEFSRGGTVIAGTSATVPATVPADITAEQDTYIIKLLRAGTQIIDQVTVPVVNMPFIDADGNWRTPAVTGASSRGPKGDKGDPLKYEDLTPEQLNSIKGPKGDPGMPPKIDSDGTWLIWDNDKGTYTDTGNYSCPKIGANGNWWTNNVDGDTGVKAQGPQGPPGECNCEGAGGGGGGGTIDPTQLTALQSQIDDLKKAKDELDKRIAKIEGLMLTISGTETVVVPAMADTFEIEVNAKDLNNKTVELPSVDMLPTTLNDNIEIV